MRLISIVLVSLLISSCDSSQDETKRDLAAHENTLPDSVITLADLNGEAVESEEIDPNQFESSNEDHRTSEIAIVCPLLASVDNSDDVVIIAVAESGSRLSKASVVASSACLKSISVLLPKSLRNAADLRLTIVVVANGKARSFNGKKLIRTNQAHDPGASVSNRSNGNPSKPVGNKTECPAMPDGREICRLD